MASPFIKQIVYEQALELKNTNNPPIILDITEYAKKGSSVAGKFKSMEKIFQFVESTFYHHFIAHRYYNQFLADPAEIVYTGQLGVEMKNENNGEVELKDLMLIYTNNRIIRAKLLSMTHEFQHKKHPIINKIKQIIVKNLPLTNVDYVVKYLKDYAEFNEKMVLVESPGRLIVTEVVCLKEGKELPKTLAVDLDLGECGCISVEASIRTFGLGVVEGDKDISMSDKGSEKVKRVSNPTTCAIE